MVLAQKIEHLLGLGCFSQGGVAAKVAEHDDDLTTMAFEDFLVTLRDDEFGQLRCQEPLQSSDAAQFLELFGNPRLNPSPFHQLPVTSTSSFQPARKAGNWRQPGFKK